MKTIKLVMIAVFILCLIFSGCGGVTDLGPDPQNTLDRFTGHYETDVSITWVDFSAQAHISQASPESCVVTYTAPQSIQDMTVTFSQDATDLDYKGLHFSFHPGSVPAAAAAKVVVSTATALQRGDLLEPSLEGERVMVKGKIDAGDFILEMDAETGGFLKLFLPSQEMEIAFDNFVVLN